MPTRSDELLEPVAAAIDDAASLVVLTGAGVSAESGISTFRDALTGLWARYDAQQLASPEAFAHDPALVTRWYDERRQRIAACVPNPGHHALAELEARCTRAGKAFTLLTQNVDRLHQQAGSRRVVELHGTLWLWRCTACGREAEDRQMPFPEHPPRCACGGMRRPAVVWFGEILPARALAEAEQALAGCELFLSLGTSAIVEPAASFVYLARQGGAITIEINLQPTPISGVVDRSLRGRTGEVLPEVLRRVRTEAGRR
jgi:NAD-dependent SIR2 family protein deacetylase